MYVDVTDATFQTEVVERSSSVPVVIDLWAPWCGPCRTLGPIIEQVIDETDGEVVLVKVNVDENPQISRAFQVQSIPLVVAVKDGQPVDGFLGAQPEAAVRDFILGLLPSEQETARSTRSSPPVTSRLFGRPSSSSPATRARSSHWPS